MSDWIFICSDDDIPPPGWYLCTISSDDGTIVRTLPVEEAHKQKRWIWEGEPTFCLPFYFEVIAYKPIPEPANFLEVGSDG